VLFIAETVTLAHLARPLVLAGALDPARYEVCLACDPRYNHLIGEVPFSLRPISSIPGERFLRSLAKGSPLYDVPTLERYVEEDRVVLEEFQPELVVGDFRLSLSVSAKLAGIPYATVTNAYWSPYARPRYTVPDLPMVRLFGVRAAQALFDLVRPVAFAVHAAPLNRLRKRHGLPSLGLDLRRTYTCADHTLYADIPELVPTYRLPAHHHYLGPVLWSPQNERPAWWEAVKEDRRVVYVTLGSSGPAALLPAVLEALAGLPVTVIAATAGRPLPARPPANAYVAAFLPGTEAAARSSLVVCNGGSLTAYQALAAGVPVLGLPVNLDQYLNMSYVAAAGAGALLRSDEARAEAIRRAAERLLDAPAFTTRARDLAQAIRRRDAAASFARLVEGWLPEGMPVS
jgi:UDP:flavonoid glycosyltransferase YjiC (YdhE family)